MILIEDNAFIQKDFLKMSFMIMSLSLVSIIICGSILNLYRQKTKNYQHTPKTIFIMRKKIVAFIIIILSIAMSATRKIKEYFKIIIA
jgi:hypothetical protein